jgi:hypothetical protein
MSSGGIEWRGADQKCQMSQFTMIAVHPLSVFHIHIYIPFSLTLAADLFTLVPADGRLCQSTLPPPCLDMRLLMTSRNGIGT